MIWYDILLEDEIPGELKPEPCPKRGHNPVKESVNYHAECNETRADMGPGNVKKMKKA